MLQTTLWEMWWWFHAFPRAHEPHPCFTLSSLGWSSGGTAGLTDCVFGNSLHYVRLCWHTGGQSRVRNIRFKEETLWLKVVKCCKLIQGSTFRHFIQMLCYLLYVQREMLQLTQAADWVCSFAALQPNFFFFFWLRAALGCLSTFCMFLNSTSTLGLHPAELELISLILQLIILSSPKHKFQFTMM